MDFLSFGEPKPAPGAQVTRTEAFVVSVGIHLLLFLLLFALPAFLPQSLREFFVGRPAPAPDPALRQGLAAIDEPSPPVATEPEIPLEFAYVKLPDDRPVEDNPTAPLLSDRNRRARQEVPTPAEVARLTIDPHSEGDSITREIPDPTIPEGIDRIEPESAGSPDGASDPGEGIDQGNLGDRSAEGDAAPEGSPDEGRGAEDARPEGGPLPRREEPDPGEEGGAIPPGSGSSKGFDYKPSEDLKSALSDMKVGERKFIFRNPGFLKGRSYGTLSFDTQDFPWGDYARKLYLIIRENWYARIPLAAREGIRGYACYRFIIARDGAITENLTIRPSAVPPFNKAAADAIGASDPLPPLPDAFPRESEGVTFCFFYNMYPGEVD
jgi:hypothetical protein